MGIRQWKLPEPDHTLIQQLIEATGLSGLICEILAARGVRDSEGAARFLGTDAHLDDPLCIADMDKAVERIQAAMEDGERIAVYGDYDCDGITATALLTSYLQAVGADVIYYVPSREKEGYGLNKAAVAMLKSQKVDLIVTVDNGVSAHDEVAYAKTLGIDVVITDHHSLRDTLPDAVAVVNPHRADCPSTFKDLAGVGVAFKLVCALEEAQGDELLEYYADMVTLGTIADVVPLIGENRIIVTHGLGHLLESERPGLSALIDVSGIRERAMTSETVAFGLIPRINAAGRMGTVDDVIELLLTDDATYAAEVAAEVNEQNVERKKIEDLMLAEIEGILSQNTQILNERVLVVSGKGWHHGVVGIVSAKLVERYGKPTILLSIDGDEARGSGRSIKGFDLIGAISACSGLLTRFGGHPLAAGLTLPATAIDAFRDQLQAYAKERYAIMPLPELSADCSIAPAKLTVENIAGLSKLEPFGAANEAPLFHLGGLVIEGIYPTADKKHIRIRFSGGGNSFYAIYFGMSSSDFPYKTGEIVEIMAKISAGEYNGKAQLSVKLSDVRPAGVPQDAILLARERYARHLREETDPEQAAALLPGREDLATVYKYLRRGGYAYGVDGLFLALMASGIDYGRLLIALDVLEEMGLMHRAGLTLAVVPNAPKVDLAQSTILMKLKAETLVNEIERV